MKLVSHNSTLISSEAKTIVESIRAGWAFFIYIPSTMQFSALYCVINRENNKVGRLLRQTISKKWGQRTHTTPDLEINKRYIWCTKLHVFLD